MPDPTTAPALSSPGGARRDRAGAGGPALGESVISASNLIARYGLLIAFLLTIVLFSLARPDTFPTWKREVDPDAAAPR